ncbi:MAG: acetylglutamate kinase [Armatimonadetes bacterium]|nr:acetylglutamate kinase [Armatimonadota bacterium]
MTDPERKAEVMKDLVLMQAVNIRPVLLHGGGPEIDRLAAKVGLETKRVDGLRVTDAETMELVEMALGALNKGLVAGVQAAGGKAAGLSGKDGGLFTARKLTPGGKDIGFVGEVSGVNPEILETLTASGYIPIVCSVAPGQEGGTYNVNADLAAGALAAALKAEKLIVMTDVEGVLKEYPNKESLLSRISSDEAKEMIASGAAGEGMIPKLQSCLDALAGGVHSAHIIDGRRPHSLLVEVFTDAGIGTMIA